MPAAEASKVGAAARDVHEKTREVLVRHFAPAPVIDAVEGSVAAPPETDVALVKYVGWRMAFAALGVAGLGRSARRA